MRKVGLILGNANKRYSGVTSTMLSLLPYQVKQFDIKVMGSHFLPDGVNSAGFWGIVRWIRTNPDMIFVFHARRNIEMLQAVILRQAVGSSRLKIFFTSTAQRHHTKWTQWLMEQMDSVVSTCEAAASYMKRQPDRIISHGVDTKKFYPMRKNHDLLEKYHIKQDKLIGIFARVRRQKGTEVLVRAALPILLAHHDTALVIVGDAKGHRAFQDGLKEMANQHGVADRVHFTGKLDYATEVPAMIASMDLVAALSLNEGFGLPVLESLSSGVPVIASQEGAWPDILQGQPVGKLVNTGDIEKTSRVLMALFDDFDCLKVMGEQGRDLIMRRYDLAHEASAYQQVIRSLAHGVLTEPC